MHSAEEKSQRNNRLLQNHIQNSTQGREPLRETQRLAAYRNSLRQMRTYLQVRNLPRCNNYLLVMSPEPRRFGYGTPPNGAKIGIQSPLVTPPVYP